MNAPKLEWYSRMEVDEKYALDNNIYAGTYTSNNPITVYLQLWNNRWGTEDVESLFDFHINMFFKDKEDSALINYCTVILNNADVLGMVYTDGYVTLEFPESITLSGIKNDGTTKNNPNNFITLQVIFDAEGTELKENDLKSLFFEIVKNE